MKRALILTVAVGLFGATLLQAGHKRHCCYTSWNAVSYQPAVATPVTTGAGMAPQASVASNGTTYRSYSYEPAANNTSYFTYTTESTGYRPTTRRTPTYMLPKTDPRKFSQGF